MNIDMFGALSPHSPLKINEVRHSARKTLHSPAQVPETDHFTFVFEKEFEMHYFRNLKLLVLDTLRKENLLGSGSEYKAYRIPKIPEFALRAPLNFDIRKDINNLPTILTRVQDVLPGIKLGQAVAEASCIQIVHFLPGTTTEIPYEQYENEKLLAALREEKDALPMLEKEIAPHRSLYKAFLQKVECMPQSAYDNLAKRIIRLKEAGLYVDPFVLNVLVDVNKKSFNTLDHSVQRGAYENIIGMACPLIDSVFVYLDGNSIGLDNQKSKQTVITDLVLTKYRHKILKKVFLAAHKLDLDLPDNPCPPLISDEQRPAFGIDFACDVSGFWHKWPPIKKMLEDKSLSSQELSNQLEQLSTVS